jgi:hypothetical protein
MQHLHQDLPLLARPVRLRQRCRPFRRRSCCSPTGSISTSTRFRRGRARSSCRWRSSTPRNRSGRSRPSRASTSCSSAAAPAPNLRLRMDRKAVLSWRNFFLVVDRVLHWPRPSGSARLRKLALRRAEKWLLERLEMSDGLGAIYPGHAERHHRAALPGLREDHPQVIRARDEFEKLGIEEPAAEAPEPTFRMQPCTSPSGTRRRPSTPSARPACRARPAHGQGRGLAAVEGGPPPGATGPSRSRNVEPGGWYFEFANEFYPDTDDTAQVLLALNKVDNPRDERQHVRRRSAPSSGSSPCSAATAAGAASTRTARR